MFVHTHIYTYMINLVHVYAEGKVGKERRTCTYICIVT